jgi:autotransporter-associated beta strand protein
MTRLVGQKRRMGGRFAAAAFVSVIIVGAARPAHAQDATWLANPGSGTFNTATNWNPAVVPTNTAIFGASNTTTILFQPFTTTSIGTLQFDPGAPGYTFATSPPLFTQIRITGAGIVNNSSNAPTFIVDNQANLFFQNASTAGNATLIVNGGGLIGFADSSTGGTARLVANAGGVFDISGLSTGGMTTGSIEGAGAFSLGSKELTVGNNNLSTTVSGTISGAGGSLVKEGRGTLTLTGNNTYTGPTTVNAGSLIVDGSIASSSLTTVTFGGLLGGTGTVGDVRIGVGGVFAPGASMTSGNLSFLPGSVFTVQANSQTATSVNVGGTALLSGLVFVNVSGTIFFPRVYPILNAGGLVIGQFENVIDNRPSFEAELIYTPHSVLLSLVFDPLAAVERPPAQQEGVGGGGTGGERVPIDLNQLRVALALINSFKATGQIPVEFGSIGTANDLSQLSGEIGTSVQQAAFNTMDRFINVLLDPSLGARGAPAAADGFAPAFASDTASTVYRKAPAVVQTDTAPRWSQWVSAYGALQRTGGDVAVGSHDTRNSIAGLAAGIDYRLSPDMLAGFGIGGSLNDFAVAGGLGSGTNDSFQAGAYVRRDFNQAYVAAALAYGFHEVTTDRSVTFAGFDALRAQFDAHSISGRAEAGYRIATPWMGIIPYTAGQFTTIFLPQYGEQRVGGGTDVFALTFPAKDVTAPRTELGLRGDTSFILADGIMTLRGRAAWAHNFDTSREAAAAFQVLPVSSFVVTGAAQDRDAALVSASAEVKWLNGFSAAATFDGEFSGNVQTYAGRGIIRYRW